MQASKVQVCSKSRGMRLLATQQVTVLASASMSDRCVFTAGDCKLLPLKVVFLILSEDKSFALHYLESVVT